MHQADPATDSNWAATTLLTPPQADRNRAANIQLAAPAAITGCFPGGVVKRQAPTTSGDGILVAGVDIGQRLVKPLQGIVLGLHPGAVESLMGSLCHWPQDIHLSSLACSYQ